MKSALLATIHKLRRVTARSGMNVLFYSGVMNLSRARIATENSRIQRIWPKISPFAVLLYHRVNPDRDPFFPSYSPEAFERQMRYLAQNFHVRPLSEVLDAVEQRKPIEPWTLAITFDDGYRDNYLYAHPILRKYRLPATIFVATGYVGTNRVMWNDRVARAIKDTNCSGFTLETPEISKRFSLSPPHDKLRTLLAVLKHLKSLPEADKESAVRNLHAQLGVEYEERNRLMLEWSELRVLVADGWEVGSHTVNHAILTKLSESSVSTELVSSKRTLEDNLQKPTTLFAYPNGRPGDFDVTTRRRIKAAGYRAALTTLNGFNGPELDPFEIRRISPWEEHLPSFATKLEWSFRLAMKQTSTCRPVETVASS